MLRIAALLLILASSTAARADNDVSVFEPGSLPTGAVGVRDGAAAPLSGQSEALIIATIGFSLSFGG